MKVDHDPVALRVAVRRFRRRRPARHRCRDGDPAALRALHDRYSSPARAVARRVLVDDNLAQDVVQDVFVTLWQHADRYDPSLGPVPAWLLSGTRHRAVDVVRREERIRRRLTQAGRHPDEATAADSVDAAVNLALDRERLHVALRHLPPPQRAVITLAYFHDLTQREIAERTGTPLGTVKTRTRAGLRHLRDLLDDQHAPLGTHPRIATTGTPKH